MEKPKRIYVAQATPDKFEVVTENHPGASEYILREPNQITLTLSPEVFRKFTRLRDKTPMTIEKQVSDVVEELVLQRYSWYYNEI